VQNLIRVFTGCVLSSNLTVYPTPSPSFTPSSSATRCATAIAATRRGCVTTHTRPPSHQPASCTYCGICVVLPQPVDPTRMTVVKVLRAYLRTRFRRPAAEFAEGASAQKFVAVAVDGQALALLRQRHPAIFVEHLKQNRGRQQPSRTQRGARALTRNDPSLSLSLSAPPLTQPGRKKPRAVMRGREQEQVIRRRSSALFRFEACAAAAGCHGALAIGGGACARVCCKQPSRARATSHPAIQVERKRSVFL